MASVVAVGCGSSSGNYVVTGSPGQPAPGTTGNLTFHFVQVQGTFEAPAGTAQIRFDLFDQTGGAGTLLDSVTRPFATTITLIGVSVQVQSVRLTYYNGLGFPVGVATVNVTVVPAGGTIDLKYNWWGTLTPTVGPLATPDVNIEGTAAGLDFSDPLTGPVN